MNALAAQSCVPCRGGVPPLDDAQIAPLLAQLNEQWRVVLRDDAKRGTVKLLKRTFAFANFSDAMAAAVKVGNLAEEQQHHPDLHVGWGVLAIEIWTHKIGGLTESDFVFAAKCDALLAA